MSSRLDFSRLTLMDALDVACLIEVEAAQRYEEFAESMGHRRAGDAASVFLSMAENERKHGEDLAQRRHALFGDTPRKVSRDDLFDAEAPDFGATRWDMSPRAAFEVALAAEQKAHAFYDTALPTVEHPDVRALFKDLREEEVEHIRLVEDILAKLPAEAANELSDEDAD
jgi:erythrin-vacuolar iron transport family protein